MSQDLAPGLLVSTYVESDEYWIMAPPGVDTSADMAEAKSLGFNEISGHWYDPEHDWDVVVLRKN
jgi:hypothetical protein